MKTVLITGASGLLGTYLSKQLKASGYRTVGWCHRNRPETDIIINHVSDLKTLNISHLHSVINLAGAAIAGGLWTRAYKQKLRSSRIDFTKHLISDLRSYEITIDHFLSGSAIGFYGVGLDDRTETSPPGQDFSAQLCLDWENEAYEAQDISHIVTLLRTGLVFTPDKGFLEPFKRMTRFGLGSVFGSGDQILSWIDYRDWTKAVLFIMDHRIAGSINLTAPDPVSQTAFVDAMAEILNKKRRLALPTPFFWPLQEMKTLFIDGQRVLPNKLCSEGFKFEYAELKSSLMKNLT